MPKPEPKKRNRYRETARQQENRLAKRVGGVRIPLSGGGSIKGDVKSKIALFECKTSHTINARGAKQLKLEKDWLVKIEEEARMEGLPFAVLEIRFKGDQKSWMLMNSERMLELLEQLKAYREQLG